MEETKQIVHIPVPEIVVWERAPGNGSGTLIIFTPESHKHIDSQDATVAVFGHHDMECHYVNEHTYLLPSADTGTIRVQTRTEFLQAVHNEKQLLNRRLHFLQVEKEETDRIITQNGKGWAEGLFDERREYLRDRIDATNETMRMIRVAERQFSQLK